MTDKETDIKQRLNETADYLHDKALASTMQGRTIALALNPESVELLARWLRTEAKTNAGDEIHDERCEAGDCTAVAALKLADQLREIRP